MKTLALALVVGAITGFAGCTSSPALKCDTTACSNSTKTYQTCANIGDTVTYNYGSASCTASDTNTPQVEACANQVAAFCAGTPVSGLDGGGITPVTGEDGGTSSTCTYTITGATTASGSCSVNAAVDTKTGGIGFTITNGTETPLTFGVTIPGQTTLTAGTYTLANVAPGGGAEYTIPPSTAWDMCTTSQNCVTASGGSGGTPQGSFTLTITNPGPVTEGVVWSSPQGTLVLTMPFTPTGTASGTVTVNVTL